MKNIYFVLYLFCLMTRLFAQEANWVNSVNEEIAQKIYIEPNQIILTDDEIFVNFGGDITSVDQLNCDANGFWVYFEGYHNVPAQWVDNGPSKKEACLNGHAKWCQYCNGCMVRSCLVGRCKCVAWE